MTRPLKKELYWLRKGHVGAAINRATLLPVRQLVQNHNPWRANLSTLSRSNLLSALLRNDDR